MPRPMPLAPPVIKATFPAKSLIEFFLLVSLAAEYRAWVMQLFIFVGDKQRSDVTTLRSDYRGGECP